MMLFDQASQAMQSGKWGEAEVICRQILAQAPGNFDAMHMLAVICAEKGEYDESERLFEKSISLDSNFPPCFYNYGRLLTKQKKYIAAITKFDKALSLFPNFVPAHCDRGSALTELGRFDEALASLNKAAGLAPNVPMVWYNKGNVHFKKKDFYSALRDYDCAVKINPNYTDAWLGRGNAFTCLKCYDEAFAAYDKALALKPDLVGAWLGRGDAFTNFKRYDEAFADYDKALALKPDLVEAWLARGNVLYSLNRYDEAIVAFDKSLALKPDLAQAYLGRGNVFIDLKRYDEAFAAYDRALALNHDLAEAWLGRGHAFTGLKRYDEASTSYDKTLALKPDLAEAWLARGDSFNNHRRYDEAVADYDKALVLKPDLAEAWLGRGNVFKDLRRYDEALVAYAKAHALKPDLAEAQCNEGLIRLILGETENGWKKYEYRWDTKLMRGLKRNFSQPLWLGDSDIKSKTILIHAEQGLGDTLMACRYIPMLAAQGAKVIAEVQPPLMSLLKNLDGISLLIAKGETIPHFDVHCPIMSLPLAFKTTMQTIPAKVPYLVVPKDSIEKWRPKLNGAEIKVGIAWAGNPNYPQDSDRSILLKNILPILGVKGARFFSLQKDLRHGDQEILAVNSEIVRLDQEINDFEDTAAIMMSLDLVISSDTSIVNLAGALSRPTWVVLSFNPDWRWLLDRSDSPWYPTARLFRQMDTGEWSTVIDDICVEIEKLVAAKKADKASYPQGRETS
jgi:tetratricopeptide (TPR) repeat protein